MSFSHMSIVYQVLVGVGVALRPLKLVSGAKGVLNLGLNQWRVINV